MIFVSRKQFLRLFTAIDGILAEIDNLRNISNSILTKSLCKNNSTAKYVKECYPDIIAVIELSLINMIVYILCRKMQEVKELI